MKDSVTMIDFIERFESMRPNSFSRDGLVALYDYLIEWEESTGEEIELDVIGICCDFTEYEDENELLGDYKDYENIDEIKDETEVIEIKNGGFIIRNF